MFSYFGYTPPLYSTQSSSAAMKTSECRCVPPGLREKTSHSERVCTEVCPGYYKKIADTTNKTARFYKCPALRKKTPDLEKTTIVECSTSRDIITEPMRTGCVYKCPGVRGSIKACSNSACQPNDDYLSPKVPKRTENMRYGWTPNRNCTHDTDSDWRSTKSSPDPSDYDTGLTTPPGSPVLVHKRKSSSLEGSEDSETDRYKIAKGNSPALFAYSYGVQGSTVAVKMSEVKARIDLQKGNSTEKEKEQRAIDAKVADLYADIATRGVHIFADCSNISISLLNTFKQLLNIPMATRIRTNNKFDWESLVRIVRRGRPVKTLNAGCSYDPNSSHKPDFIQDLYDAGFTVDERKRVQKGYGKMKEHLVDEQIQSRVDDALEKYKHEKGTIILITGDGKPAEQASGFKSYAKHALKHGWNVELVCWNYGCSQAWRDESWEKYGLRYRLISLDDYLGDLWHKAY